MAKKPTAKPSDLPTSENVPSVAVGTNFVRQKYLFAFASQPEVMQYLRTQTVSDEAKRIPEIIAAWNTAQQSIQGLFHTEQNACDSIQIESIPDAQQQRVARLLDNDLFRKTFQLPTSAELVEIDKLVAAQRTVNVEYVDKLVAEFSKNPAIDELITICLSADRPLAAIQHLELGPNAHVFSSPSGDLRFLGAFLKDLTADDLKYAQSGGVPAAAIITFVGYGAYPVNVYKVGNRVVLGNGFHRVFALRSMGVKKVPVIVQHVNNPQLEFPPNIAGVPREYLLGHSRPVLMKDFFEDRFTTILKVHKRMRVVSFQIGPGQHDVPA